MQFYFDCIKQIQLLSEMFITISIAYLKTAQKKSPHPMKDKGFSVFVTE